MNGVASRESSPERVYQEPTQLDPPSLKIEWFRSKTMPDSTKATIAKVALFAAALIASIALFCTIGGTVFLLAAIAAGIMTSMSSTDLAIQEKERKTNEISTAVLKPVTDC